MAARLAACAAAVVWFLLSPSSSLANSTVADGYRTGYHFQPAMHWMNDPNGPMYFRGLYHFFYQYNPLAATWGNGNLSWGHSVSTDLINWSTLKHALVPDSPSDNGGCWSGSATILPDGSPVIVYTGINASAFESQNLAFPKNLSDPFLRDWAKPEYNPVIPLPRDVDRFKFRDPSTAWLGHDSLWRVAVAAGFYDGTGSTLVYRTKDFKNWERNPEPLYSSGDAGMLECPDLFPVAGPGDQNGLDYATSNGAAGVMHVLKQSVMVTRSDYYVLGRYNDDADTFTPVQEADRDCRNWQRFDYGNVYASKSFYDAGKNRRVLWSWVNETDNGGVARGWAGVQIVPRKIWLASDGRRLLQWPVEEVNTLRRKRVGLLGGEVNAGGMHEIVGVAGTQVDVEIVFEVPALEGAESLYANQLDPQRLCGEEGASGGVGPFGLIVLASADMEERTSIFFKVFRERKRHMVLMCTDLSRSTKRADVYKPTYGAFVDIDIEKERAISLRTLVDHSILESYGGGGRTVITARAYPEHAKTTNSRLLMFNNGTAAVKVPKLDAWDMTAASMNTWRP